MNIPGHSPQTNFESVLMAPRETFTLNKQLMSASDVEDLTGIAGQQLIGTVAVRNHHPTQPSVERYSPYFIFHTLSTSRKFPRSRQDIQRPQLANPLISEYALVLGEGLEILMQMTGYPKMSQETKPNPRTLHSTIMRSSAHILSQTVDVQYLSSTTKKAICIIPLIDSTPQLTDLSHASGYSHIRFNCLARGKGIMITNETESNEHEITFSPVPTIN